MSSPRRPTSIHIVLATSVLSASLGATAGFLVGKVSLPPDYPGDVRAMLGVYASAGAVTGVVLLRLFAIAHSLWKDFRHHE